MIWFMEGTSLPPALRPPPKDMRPSAIPIGVVMAKVKARTGLSMGSGKHTNPPRGNRGQIVRLR